MATTKAGKSQGADPGAAFAASAANAQAQTAQLLNQHNELLSQAARALWDSQTRLLQLQAEQVTTLLAVPSTTGDPGEMMATYCQQWHDSAERLIAHWRQMNDLMRNTHWQLMEAHAENLRQITRPMLDAAAAQQAEPPKA